MGGKIGQYLSKITVNNIVVHGYIKQNNVSGMTNLERC